jgi:hypothetical protein
MITEMNAPKLVLTLYVTPVSSREALSNLYRALSVLDYTDYQLELIDMSKEPERAQEANIVGPATLVWHRPEGVVRVEKLADTALVRRMLQLN